MKHAFTLVLMAGLVLGVLLAGNRHRGSDTLAILDVHRGAAGNAAGGSSSLRMPEQTLVVSGGTLQDMGILADGLSQGTGLNDAGEVVGQWRADLGADPIFLPPAGGTNDPRMLPAGGAGCGINGSGQIVGWARRNDGIHRAFLFEAGVTKDLGTLGGADSEALAINNSGDIVGRAALPDGSGRVFLYSRGVMKDLGTLGGDSSAACAINDAGDVAGWSSAGSMRQHAFLWTPRSLHPQRLPTGIHEGHEGARRKARQIVHE
jgi:probable HAF family extracellular repeat protein